MQNSRTVLPRNEVDAQMVNFPLLGLDYHDDYWIWR